MALTQPHGPILACGAVVLRGRGAEQEVLVVHRARRADWSLPKGKVERGEHFVVTAVRETLEETGVSIVLGAPLTTQHYLVAGRPKTVRYWAARALAEGTHEPDDEVDEVRWVPVDRVDRLLTYPADAGVVAEAVQYGVDTVPLVVLRHAQAEKRADFAARHDGHPPDDEERPLTRLGQRQAQELAELLGAYGLDLVVSSTARRCLETIGPYLRSSASGEHPAELRREPRLTETAHAREPQAVQPVVADVLTQDRPTVICTHRPVLPDLLQALESQARTSTLPRSLAPGASVVLHRRDGRVVALEQHHP